MSTDLTRKQEIDMTMTPAIARCQLSVREESVLQQVFGELGGPVLHNFQGDRMEVWRQLAKWTAVETLSYDDVKDGKFSVRHFIAQSIRIAGNDPGEVIDGLRCVLIPPDGKAVAFVSAGIARDLAGLIQTFGMGPYEPAIEVQVIEVRTRKGFRTYRLIPAE